MIVGIGVDLCSISRVNQILEREGMEGPFFRRTFTPAEQKEALAHSNPAAFFAARFAVKEAVFKAVAPHTSKKPELRKIESLHRNDGSPYVHVDDMLALCLGDAGISRLHLSVTTEADFAQAFVIAEG